MKKYKINDVEFTQDELAWNQDKKLILILKEHLGGDFNIDLGSLSIMEIFDKLTDNDLVEQFLSIVLIPVKKINIIPELFGDIKNSELEAVITDFFTLNKRLIERLTEFGSNYKLKSSTTPTPTTGEITKV